MWIDERVASQVNETYCSPLFMNQVDVYSMFVDTVKLCIFQLVTAKKKYEYFLGF